MSQAGSASSGDGSSPFIGRAEEYGLLRGAALAAESGRGSVVVVRGQAGLGKTTLCRAALSGVGRVLLVEGRAWATGGGLACAPIADVLREALRAAGPQRSAEVVARLPELRALLPDLAPAVRSVAPGPPPAPRSASAGVVAGPLAGAPGRRPSGDPELERLRLLESVATVLGRLARRQPLALLLDDVHAADDATAQLLGYAIRRLADAPVAFVLVHRPLAGLERPAVQALLEVARRDREAITVTLPPLVASEIQAMIEWRCGASPSAPLLDWVMEQTGGVPLFVRLVIDAVLRTRHTRQLGGILHPNWSTEPDLGGTGADTLVALVSRFSEAQRRLLEVLAVAGDGLSLRTLAAVDGADADRILGDLEHLLAHGWVSEDAQGVWAVAHPLMSEVAVGQVSATRRRRLHDRIAGSLRDHRGTRQRQLARHLALAWPDLSEPARAARELQAAADDAWQRLAYEDAALFWRVALAIAHEADPPRRQAELAERLGQALDMARRMDRSQEAWRVAADAWRQVGDDERWAESTRQRALALWELGRSPEALEQVGEALDRLQDRPSSHALARLHLASLVLCRRGAHVERVERAAARADAWLRQTAGLEHAFGGVPERAMVQMMSHAAARRHAAALEVAAEVTRADGLSRSLFNYAWSTRLGMAFASRLDCDEAALEAFVQAREAVGGPYMDMLAHLVEVWTARKAGRLPDAVRAADRLLAHTVRVEASRFRGLALYLCGWLRAWMGELAAASAYADEVERVRTGRAGESVKLAAWAGITRLLVRLEGQELSGVAELARSLPEHTDILLCEVLRVRALIDCGAPVEATLRVACLRELYPEVPAAEAFALRFDGQLASAPSTSPSDTALALSAQAFEALDMPFEAARSRLLHAELRPEEVQDGELRGVFDAFASMGAQRYADRTRRLLRDRGQTLRRPRATPREMGLSARELEVARMAARGLRNKDIAARLYVSPHTVSTHLKRIYARLDVRGRTALAQWLVAHGLAENDPAHPEAGAH